MNLEVLVSRTEGFDAWSHAERIRLFAWYLHRVEGLPSFTTSDIAKCFDRIFQPRPANIASHLSAMAGAREPTLIRRNGMYQLARPAWQPFDSKFSERSGTIETTKLLESLLTRLPAPTQTDYLDEALRCFRANAFRAAIVMTWNLAYDEMCRSISGNRLVAFNSAIPDILPKSKVTIAKHEDFGELKEFDVLRIARAAGLLSRSRSKLLHEKLDKRNAAAHPSGIVFDVASCEAFICDLINNMFPREGETMERETADDEGADLSPVPAQGE